MKYLAMLTVVFLLFLAGCNTLENTSYRVYYVDSAAGNDLNAGTSPDKAWKTLEKINGADLEAGDQVLLKAGQEFRGSIRLKNLTGTASAPILLASYGKGKAAIESEDSL